MLTRFSLGLLSLLALSIVSGCATRPGCVIDTDCPLGQYCSVDQRCELLGPGEDTGTGSVDAARADGGDAGSVDAARDASGADGGNVDGSASDTGPVADGGPCMGVLGTYTLSSSPAACPTPIADFVVASGANACEVVLTSRGEATFGGTMTSTGGSTFMGALSIGTTSYPRCTLAFSTRAANIDCGGGCVIPATLP